MQKAKPIRRRSGPAMICLLAVALLYAPLASAAWSAYKAACCTSGQCPIPEHHHHPVPSAPTHHMDCGHDISAMMSCSMACCPNAERAAVASGVFVVPPPFLYAAPAGLTSAIKLVNPLNSPRSVEPLSPPPRIITAAA